MNESPLPFSRTELLIGREAIICDVLGIEVTD